MINRCLHAVAQRGNLGVGVAPLHGGTALRTGRQDKMIWRDHVIRPWVVIGPWVAMGLAVTPLLPAYAASRQMTCGTAVYVIEGSLLGTAVSQQTAAGRTAYCQSSDRGGMVAALTVKGNEIWCVETYRITPDSWPYAKSSRLLNIAVNRQYEYDYVWQNGDWQLTDKRQMRCDMVEIPESD